MIMSESEILTSIRTAANPWEQVQVVADLNAMSRKEMEKYLTDIGFELPTRTNRIGRKPGTTAKKAAAKTAKTVDKYDTKKAEEPVKAAVVDDSANHPAHYTAGNIECIQAIEAALSEYNDPMDAFLVGEVIKYLWRAPLKGSYAEDLRKGEYCMSLLIRRNAHE